MAVTRMVIGCPPAGVTIAAGTFTADVTFGTLASTGYAVAGSPANFGTGSTAGASSAWAEGQPVTFRDGDVLYLDSAGGATSGPARLYQALAAAGATFRAWTANDETGHAALGN